MPCSRAESMVEVRFDEIRGASAARAIAIPAWRIESSRATSCRVRSGISSPERAGSAIPMPAPARTCGIDRPPRRGRREQRQAADPAGDQQAARDRPGLRVAREPRRDDRRDRQHADRERRGERLDAPARDQQQHDQEDHRGQGGREQRQGGRGAERQGAARAVRVAAGGWEPLARRARPAGRPAAPGGRSAPGRGRSPARRRPGSARRRAPVRRRSRRPTPPPTSGARIPGLPPSSSSKAATRPPAAPSAWTPRSASSSPSELEAPQPIEAAKKSASPAAPTCASPKRRQSQAAGRSASARTAV